MNKLVEMVMVEVDSKPVGRVIVGVVVESKWTVKREAISQKFGGFYTM